MTSPELYVIMKSTWKITKEESDVIKRCAVEYKTTDEKMLSKTRTRELVTPRHCAMFILNRMMKCSWKHIGKIMAKDHSSCIHGARTYQDLILRDEKERARLKSILRSIGYAALIEFERDYPMIQKPSKLPDVKHSVKPLDKDFGRKVFLGEI